MVEVTVTPDDGGAQVTIESRSVAPEWQEQSEQGWRELLGRLEDVLREGAGEG